MVGQKEGWFFLVLSFGVFANSVCLSVCTGRCYGYCVLASQRCELHFTGPPIWSIQIYKSNPYLWEANLGWERKAQVWINSDWPTNLRLWRHPGLRHHMGGHRNNLTFPIFPTMYVVAVTVINGTWCECCFSTLDTLYCIVLYCIRAPPKRGRHWEIHPRRPRDFPRPERFPEGEAWGKFWG